MEPVVRSNGVPPSAGIAGDDPILLEVEQVKGYISGMARSLLRGDLKDLVRTEFWALPAARVEGDGERRNPLPWR